MDQVPAPLRPHLVIYVAGTDVYKDDPLGGLDLTFSISAGEAQVKFFLHNLFLEIATVDRDEEPLRFDERLKDFGFFLSKTADLIQSKLRILLHLMEEEDVEGAIKKIQADAAGYERVRIWRRLDNSDQDKQNGGGAYD